MKKTLLALIMGVIMITSVSCSSSRRVIKHSEILKQAEQVINDGVKDVNAATSCDELDSATITAVFGLILIPDIDQMKPAEEEEFDKMCERLSKAIDRKKAVLGCEDDDDDE